MSRPVRTEIVSTSSELSDSSMVLDDHQRSYSRQRQSKQRTLSSSSIANLLSNLQNIQLPSSSLHLQINEQQQQQQQQEDDCSLQLLIDVARDIDSTRIDKLNRIHSFVEDSIGMVELLSLFRFIKSLSSSQMNINEPPLNLYSSILPTLIALLLLENDI
jgi:hypothetical protein